MANNAHPPDPLGTTNRGALLKTIAVDRTMKCHVVSDLELDTMARSGIDSIIAFSIGSLLLGYGLDWMIEYVANDYTQGLSVAAACFVGALAFYAWGGRAWWNKRSLVQKIRESSDE